MRNLRTIDDILLEKIDFTSLNEAEKEQALEDIKNIILENTFIRLLDKMDDGEVEEFSNFLNSEKRAENIVSYLEEHFPLFNEILFEEVKFVETL